MNLVPAAKEFHSADFSEVVDRHLPQDSVPFVIPDLNRDLKSGIFLTVSLAQHHSDPNVRRMYWSASRYFAKLNSLAIAAKQGDRKAMMQFERMLNFPERPEVRFGYTAIGHRGSAVGNGRMGATLRDFLLEHPAFLESLQHVPDMLQLIPRMDMDRISDALGSIVLRELVLCTQEYARRFGFQPSCMRVVKWRNVWNAETCAFDEMLQGEVPVDHHNSPILLIDKRIVRGTRAIDSRDFSDATISGERTHRGPSKRELIAHLQNEPDKLQRFAMARLEGIKPHSKFQEGRVQRRKRR